MRYPSHIQGTIKSDICVIGQGVIVEPSVTIEAKSVSLGDFSYIGRDVRILTKAFSIGEYSKLHEHTFSSGAHELSIGHNCWIGGHCVLDAQSGLRIDDNVGIGAHSQLWTHMKFGDIVEGCRFYSEKPMWVQKDAWLVGHCIVSPVTVGAKSMALAGSVVTKDMEPNHVYAGTPAQDITHKVGPQFTERTVAEKAKTLHDMINLFEHDFPHWKGVLHATVDTVSAPRAKHTYFNCATRTYNKSYSAAEVAFLKKWVPLVKFTPDV